MIAATISRVRLRVLPRPRAAGSRRDTDDLVASIIYGVSGDMRSIIACPNAEVETSVAPSISLAKS